MLVTLFLIASLLAETSKPCGNSILAEFNRCDGDAIQRRGLCQSMPKILERQEGEADIQHVVHLMLENRAFDTIFGYLGHNMEIDNLVGKRFCNYLVSNDSSSPVVCTGPTLNLTVDFSPNHKMSDIFSEIYGHLPTSVDLKKNAPMSGFAHKANTKALLKANGNLEEIQQIMAGFDPEKIPIHKTLAENYMVADRWFASVPGPTTPNRLFAHAATSSGLSGNSIPRMTLGLRDKTILNDLSNDGYSWKSYFSDLPSLANHRRVRQGINKFSSLDMICKTRPIRHFYKDAADGNLANYNFIEPNYGSKQSFLIFKKLSSLHQVMDTRNPVFRFEKLKAF